MGTEPYPDPFLDAMQVLHENLRPSTWALEELARQVREEAEDPYALEHVCSDHPGLASIALGDAMGMLAERLQEREP